MKEALKYEDDELNILLNEGMKYKAGIFTFHIKPLTARTILKSAKYQVKMATAIDEANENVYEELINNIKLVYKFIATCTFGSGWKSLFTKILYWFLMRFLSPQKAVKLSVMILKMYDLANFIPSIRYIAQLRMTMPKESPRIEKANGQA